MHDKKRAFEAKMSKPLFPAPEREKKKKMKRKLRPTTDESTGDDGPKKVGAEI